jgi:hypothetical protein
MLFNLKEMREKSMQLNGEERKNYAQKVVVDFWRALGGDEEEIKNLDDDNSD